MMAKTKEVKEGLPSFTIIRVAAQVLKIPDKKLGIAVCKVGTLYKTLPRILRNNETDWDLTTMHGERIKDVNRRKSKINNRKRNFENVRNCYWYEKFS